MIVTIFSGNIGSVKAVATVGDSKVLNFTVAVDKHFTSKGGDKVTETTWVECSLWNREKVFPFLKVGSHVVIQGDVSARAYIDKDDAKKAIGVLTCTVDTVEFQNKAKSEEK
jgi:single-strand DNA-binding protein